MSKCGTAMAMVAIPVAPALKEYSTRSLYTYRFTQYTILSSTIILYYIMYLIPPLICQQLSNNSEI